MSNNTKNPFAVGVEVQILRSTKFSVLGLLSEQQPLLLSPGTDPTNTIQQQKQQQQQQQQQEKGVKEQKQNKEEVQKQKKEKGTTTTTTTTTKQQKPKNHPNDDDDAIQQQQVQQQSVWTTNELLIKDYERIVSVGEECISTNELQQLLLRKGRLSMNNNNNENNDNHNNSIILYDGFEPSGRMHIAQGVFKAMNVNKCTYEGTNSTFVFWVADWFALMNDKMGGDLEKIKIVGKYLIEVWKAAGMNIQNVVFKWASEEITFNANKYWPIMLDITRRFTITRIKKCCQIMGRLEGNLTAAQILYPLMQCTDVFFLQADICQLGVDQRKVNMLAREYCDYSKRKYKPIILSHHMLYGLKAGQEKMSKSDPDSAIFMEDTSDDVERKILQAYCPNHENTTIPIPTTTTKPTTTTSNDAGKESLQLKEDTLKNPCLDYIEHIIFSPPDAIFVVGDKTYTDFISVKTAFLSGTISEQQLKEGLIDSLNLLLEPVRQHFTNDENAKNLLDLVQQYKQQPTTTSSSSIIRRLDLVALQKVPANTHLVFVPMPTPQPTIQMLIDILYQIKLTTTDQKCVLYLQDWSAIVTNSCNADMKTIQAYYTIVLSSLRILNSTFMSNVQIIYQSEAILLDPSNYWINVINVGRYFMLNDIMGTFINDEDNVGLVIAQLMKVADVVSVAPLSLSLYDYNTSSASGNNNNGIAQLEASIIKQFYEAKLIGMTPPNITTGTTTMDSTTTTAATTTISSSIRLQPIRESDAFKTENDEYYILDDPKVHGKSKLKKAFCEPGNITFCPPIAIASVFALDTSIVGGAGGTFEIKRSAENGGDRIYSSRSELEQDYAQGEAVLHPGDLKASVTPIIMNVLETIAANIQKDKTVNAAAKTLKAFLKKKK